MITITKDMEVGIAKIDAEHKELVDRLNYLTSTGIESANKEETQKTIDLLGKYVVKHFGGEEQLMIQSKYPQFEEHKKQHKIFIDEFNKLNAEFKTNGYSAKFNVALKSSIINWIVKHIKSVDIQFGKYYCASKV